jgi:hypothetical protein
MAGRLKKMAMRFNGEVFLNFDKIGAEPKIIASKIDIFPCSCRPT